MLPFTREQFLENFASYNAAVWPSQIGAYFGGAGIVVLLFRSSPHSGRLIASGLALMWMWTGIFYHGVFFSAINGAANAFALLFVAEALLLLYFGVYRQHLAFAPPANATGWTGAALMGYAAFVYPLLAVWTGHTYPEMPMFGITPCPVTLFTFGVLLLATSRVSVWLLVIPLAWSLIGGTAAFLLSILPDWILLVSGVLAVPLILLRQRRLSPGKITS